MNFKQMHDWAAKNSDKGPTQYALMGMKSDTRFVKVRSMIKDIVKRTAEIQSRIEMNNKSISQIEDYVQLLKGYGVDVLKELGETKVDDKRPMGSGIPS